MKGFRHIVLVLFCTCTAMAQAAKQQPAATTLTQEEKMRLDYYLYAAISASDKGNHPTAYFLLEFCYKIDSLNPTVCSLLGGYTESLHGAERALPLLERAYNGAPQDYWYRYVVTLYNTGNKAQAEKVLTDLERKNPKDDDVLDLHERLLRHQHKYKQALRIHDKIDRITGEPSVYSVVTRYEILEEMGAHQQAVKVLDAYLKKNPNEGRLRAMREDIDLNNAMQKKDIPTGRALVARQMESPEVSLHTKIQLIDKHASWLQYSEAESDSMLFSLQEQYPYEQEIHNAIMARQIERGEIESALERGQTILKMNPANNDIRKKMLALYRALNDLTGSMRLIEQSYAVLPDDAEWGLYKAIVLNSRDDTDSTLLVLANALEHATEPDMKLSILQMQGDICGAKGRYEQAYEAYEKALLIQPDETMVLNNYAYTLAINGGDLKKAERMSQQAIRKNGNNPTFLDTYAWILHLQGQDNLALFYMKKALEYAEDKNEPVLNEHLDTILQAIKNQQ